MVEQTGRNLQCCKQGKDAAWSEDKRRCCAVGTCCHEVLSARSRKDTRDTLRAALTCAVQDEVITRDPVAAIKLSNRRESRRRRRQAWTVDDARWFLESAWHAGEALYAAFVLILVLGLRKGEVLGLTGNSSIWTPLELYVGEQLQRVGGQLLRREVKTETSEAPMPLPGLCVTALKLRRRQQDADRARAGQSWIETGLVFTTSMAPTSSRGTSTAVSSGALPPPRCRPSPCTAPGRPAGRCWLLWTCTRAWRCRSVGTARSPSRWRSTPRYPRPPPVMRSTSSASGWAARTLLYFGVVRDIKRPIPPKGTGR